jgi:RNA polymerase sigma factor (sigma-70 family)
MLNNRRKAFIVFSLFQPNSWLCYWSAQASLLNIRVAFMSLYRPNHQNIPTLIISSFVGANALIQNYQSGNKIACPQVISCITDSVETKLKGKRLQKQDKLARFEQATLPHLDAAYNLARWLTRNDQDAEDVVQNSYLRAFRSFDGFRGGDGRAWLLAIVRNTGYNWLQQNRVHELSSPFDEEIHGGAYDTFNPERLLLQSADNQMLREALEELPVEFREVIILRELEDLSYKEIADISGMPIGTVMSRLARGRKRLQRFLAVRMSKEI